VGRDGRRGDGRAWPGCRAARAPRAGRDRRWEMLMGLGALATIGVQRPPNLALAVFDNGRYAETGMQASHTDHGVSLCGVARSCGIEGIYDIADSSALQDFARLVHTANHTLFARIAIRADEPPRILPSRDGVLLKNRFRRALGLE